MKSTIKNAREKKGMLVRELAGKLGIDQALVSKFESGARKPTRAQVIKIAEVLGLDKETLLIEWLKNKLLYEIGDDELALKAIKVAESEITYKLQQAPKGKWPIGLRGILTEIDKLKHKLDQLRAYDSYRIAQALELEYTFESNRIEGNTLTLKETDLVINEGLTISGKTMREHLEAINHKEAIAYIKMLTETKSAINEREVLSIHNLILRGIHPEQAGVYRNVQVMIKGSSFTPPAPYLVQKQMEDFFIWFDLNKNKLHPVLLAAEAHERLVTIHPFIDGNGRTSRLLMNLILLQHGYVIANIKGDSKSRMAYYLALEEAQSKGNKTPFLKLVAEYELDALKRYVQLLS